MIRSKYKVPIVFCSCDVALSGATVPNRITGSCSRGFDVEFTPTESGQFNLYFCSVTLSSCVA